MNAKEVAFAGVFSVAGSLNSIKDYQDKSWNYNTSRNNMQENSLLYATCYIFEFSRVWENLEYWLVFANKLYWIAQPYFSNNLLTQS